MDVKSERETLGTDGQHYAVELEPHRFIDDDA
jgi:hypothetical protein